MGGNMVHRLALGGHDVVAYNRSRGPVEEAAVMARSAPLDRGPGAEAAGAPRHLADGPRRRRRPTSIWTSWWSSRTRRPVRRRRQLPLERHQGRAERVKARGIHFSTVAPAAASGVCRSATASWSAAPREAFAVSSRSSRRWRPKTATAYAGPNGAGHFVKMVHNGIEYGMMQAYAEGFEILEKSEYPLDLGKSARSGSTAASCARGCSTSRSTRSTRT